MRQKKHTNYWLRTFRGASADAGLPEFVKLGMREEALRLARINLKKPRLIAQEFNEALDAILVHADKLKPWTKLVEAAYGRLRTKERSSARSLMFCFHYGNKNYEAAVQFVPRRITNALDLILSMRTMLALRQMDDAKLLAAKFNRYNPKALPPSLVGAMDECIAEFAARNDAWEIAFALWDNAQLCEPFHRTSLPAMVEAHVARARLAVYSGLRSLEVLRKNCDPEIEITLPKNADRLCDETELELKQWEKKLKRILPEKRWGDFKHLNAGE